MVLPAAARVAIVPVLAVHGQEQSPQCVDITPHPDKTNLNIHRAPSRLWWPSPGGASRSGAVSA